MVALSLLPQCPACHSRPSPMVFMKRKARRSLPIWHMIWGGGLKVNVGFRYTWDKINGCTAIGSTSEAVASEAECINGAASLTAASQNRVRTDAPTWQVGLDWQVTPDLFAYAVTRRGYRTGAVNSPTFSGRLRP